MFDLTSCIDETNCSYINSAPSMINSTIFFVDFTIGKNCPNKNVKLSTVTPIRFATKKTYNPHSKYDASEINCNHRARGLWHGDELKGR